MALKRNDLGNFLFMHLSFIIYSFVSVASKTVAGQEPFSPAYFGFALLVFGILIIYALFWQQVLKHNTLVKAYSNKGVVVIWNLIWAALLFKESITVQNIVGSAIIITGIAVVSSDDN